MYCWMDHIKHLMGYDQSVSPHHEHIHDDYEMNMTDTDVGNYMYDNSPYLWGEMNGVYNNPMDTDENKTWHMHNDEYYEMENLIGGSHYPNMENDTAGNITDGEYEHKYIIGEHTDNNTYGDYMGNYRMGELMGNYTHGNHEEYMGNDTSHDEYYMGMNMTHGEYNNMTHREYYNMTHEEYYNMTHGEYYNMRTNMTHGEYSNITHEEYSEWANDTTHEESSSVGNDTINGESIGINATESENT